MCCVARCLFKGRAKKESGWTYGESLVTSGVKGASYFLGNTWWRRCFLAHSGVRSLWVGWVWGLERPGGKVLAVLNSWRMSSEQEATT